MSGNVREGLEDRMHRIATRIGGILLEQDAPATVFYDSVSGSIVIKTDIPVNVETRHEFPNPPADLERAAQDAARAFIFVRRGTIEGRNADA